MNETANSEQLRELPSAGNWPAARRSTLRLFAVNCSLLTALATGCHSSTGPTPLDQLNGQQTHGHEVFQTRCAQCHNDRVDSPLHGPSLLGIYKKPYLPTGAPANDDRVTAVILHGRNLMPPQPDLDPQQNSQDLPDLLAYLHTL